MIVLPWGKVEMLRSGYSNEVLTKSGTKFQLWAIPVSLRARGKAARREARATAEKEGRASGRRGRGGWAGGMGGGFGGGGAVDDGPTRAEFDKVMDELRAILEARGKAATAQGEVSVRWAYEVVGPALAGVVLLAVLLAVG